LNSTTLAGRSIFSREEDQLHLGLTIRPAVTGGKDGTWANRGRGIRPTVYARVTDAAVRTRFQTRWPIAAVSHRTNLTSRLFETSAPAGACEGVCFATSGLSEGAGDSHSTHLGSRRVVPVQLIPHSRGEARTTRLKRGTLAESMQRRRDTVHPHCRGEPRCFTGQG